jgi:hypothetical protein
VLQRREKRLFFAEAKTQGVPHLARPLRKVGIPVVRSKDFDSWEGIEKREGTILIVPKTPPTDVIPNRRKAAVRNLLFLAI